MTENDVGEISLKQNAIENFITKCTCLLEGRKLMTLRTFSTLQRTRWISTYTHVNTTISIKLNTEKNWDRLRQNAQLKIQPQKFSLLPFFPQQIVCLLCGPATRRAARKRMAKNVWNWKLRQIMKECCRYLVKLLSKSTAKEKLQKCSDWWLWSELDRVFPFSK